MNRPLMLAIAAFLLLVGISLAGKGQTVMAGHGCHGCHGCYRPAWCAGCYGGSGGCYGCRGCYGCYGCYAYPIRRTYSYARYWACGGCDGGAVVYRCSGCYCDGWADCGGCHAASVVEPTEAAPPSKSQKPEARKSTADSRSEEGQILISLQVPSDAKVFINGYLTKSTGGERLYVAQVSDPDLTYAYEVSAQIVRDGQTLVQTESARLRAGERTDLRFAFESTAPAEPPSTQSASMQRN